MRPRPAPRRGWSAALRAGPPGLPPSSAGAGPGWRRPSRRRGGCRGRRPAATGRSAGCDRSARRRCARPSPACAAPPARSGEPSAPRPGSRAVPGPGDTGRRSPAPVPARSAVRPATPPALRCSSRCAKRSARGSVAAAPGRRCSRSARSPRPRRARSSLPHAAQAIGMLHGCASGGRRLTIGETTRGMTSPAFSMTTVSPSRRSLRAMSSAL